MESEQNSYYFEGPEKNLEVWFRPPESTTATPLSSREVGLRQIPRFAIAWMSRLNHSLEALGKYSSAKCAAQFWVRPTPSTWVPSFWGLHKSFGNSNFFFSESSMFITSYRFILKTCGQTTLLYALPKLLELAGSVGLDCIEVRDNQKNFCHLRNIFTFFWLFLRNCSFRGITWDGLRCNFIHTSPSLTKSSFWILISVRLAFSFRSPG